MVLAETGTILATKGTNMVAANTTVSRSNQDLVPLALAQRSGIVIDNPSKPTAEDIRVHAWILDRLVAVHRERSSIRAKLTRLLFGDEQN